MPRENLEAVRGVYDGWARGDLSVGLPLFADDVVLVVHPEIPDAGSYEGRSGIRGYMRRFLEPWESLTIAGESFRDAGDRVLVTVRQTGTGVMSGLSMEMRYFQVWTFAGDRVIRLESIMNEEQAHEAAGILD